MKDNKWPKEGPLQYVLNQYKKGLRQWATYENSETNEIYKCLVQYDYVWQHYALKSAGWTRVSIEWKPFKE